MQSHLRGVLILLVVATSEAKSQSFTGNDLLEKLKARDLATLQYVAGVVDAAAASKNFFEANPAGLSEQVAGTGAIGMSRLWGCRPERATYGQVADVTISYLSSRPNVRHLDATLLIAFAMKDAWPCPTNK